jgi:hypothetical protein
VPGATAFAQPSFLEVAQPKTVDSPPISVDPPPTLQSREWRHWLLPVIGLVTMSVGLVLAIQNWPRHFASPQKLIGSMVQAPWATLFDASRPVLVVASDPNIEEIQRVAHRSVTLSDYANGDYLPHDIAHLSPFQIGLMKDILRGNKMADFDGGIIVGLQSLLPSGTPRLLVKGARAIRIQDLETDDNLVLLGSPRSNPWTSMYDPLLDFRFTFDDQTQREFIRNLRPAKGEKSEYIPTAGGYDTGQSFATVSVLKNPDHAGRVLIIAGANGEGTQAAGDLVTNPLRWEEILRPCHLSGSVPKQSLEILLQLGTMAGSANDVKVVACHLLAPG